MFVEHFVMQLLRGTLEISLKIREKCSIKIVSISDNNGAVPRPPSNRNSQPPPIPARKPDSNPQLFDLIGAPQKLPSSAPVANNLVLPGLNKAKQPEILQRLSVATGKDDQFPDESFFEMLMKCQGSRIEEQRSSLPQQQQQRGAEAPTLPEHHQVHQAQVAPVALEAPTVPDEDFFNLIQRLQSGRMEDQRATLQPK